MGRANDVMAARRRSEPGSGGRRGSAGGAASAQVPLYRPALALSRDGVPADPDADDVQESVTQNAAPGGEALTPRDPHGYHQAGPACVRVPLARPTGIDPMKLTDLILNRSRWPDYDEVVIDSGGYPIVLSIWPAARHLPGRGCLVFSPGTGDHPLLYLHYLEGLAQAGYHVVGVHFAGTGKSPRIDLKYTWATFKQNVRDAVGFTRERFGGPVGLVGSSQGGLLTFQMAAELEGIDLAVCHNIGVPANADSVELTLFPGIIRHFRWLPQALIDLSSRAFPTWAMPVGTYLYEDGIFPEGPLRRMNRTDPIKNRHLPYRFFSTFISSRPATPLAELRLPLLVMTGELDRIFPLSYTRRYFERIGSEDKELLVFDGLGHMFMVEQTETALPPALDWLHARRPPLA